MGASALRTAWPLMALLGGCSVPAAQDPPPVAGGLGTGGGEEATADAVSGPVFGAEHDQVRVSLAESSVARVRLGGGGRSVKFRLTLEDDTVAQFKPAQTYAAHWYSEVAAYYIDRALSLGRVPPTTGRRLAWSTLRRTAEKSPHVDEVVIDEGKTVRGSLTWWVPTKLVKLDPPAGWEAWLSTHAPPKVSPFQERSRYRRAVARAKAKAKAKPDADEPRAEIEPPAPTFADRPAELSDLILFDYLIGNLDRWGGSFTNVRTLGPDGPLVYIDNANGFHRGREPDEQARAQLAAVQKMRLSTVEALEAFDIAELRETMAQDPVAPVLTEQHFDDLQARRQEILDHIAAMQAEFGEEATPW